MTRPSFDPGLELIPNVKSWFVWLVSRSSSREVRIRVEVFLCFLSDVYFSRRTLPQKKGKKGHLAGGPRCV